MSGAGVAWRQKQLKRQAQHCGEMFAAPVNIDANSSAAAEDSFSMCNSPSELVIKNLDTGGEITIRDVKQIATTPKQTKTGKLGYLMKKGQDTTTLGFKSKGKFQKRWFSLKDGVLSYYSEDKTTLKKVYPSFSKDGVPESCPKTYEFYISVPNEKAKDGDSPNITVALQATSKSEMESWLKALQNHIELNMSHLEPDLEFARQIEQNTQGAAFEGLSSDEIKQIIAEMSEDEAAEAWQNFRDELITVGFMGFDVVKEKHLVGFNAREPISAMFDVALFGSICDEVVEFTGNTDLKDLDYFLGWKSGFQGRSAIKQMKKGGEEKYSEAVLTDVFLCGLRDRIYKMCMIAGSSSFALNMDKVQVVLFETAVPSEFDACHPDMVLVGDTVYDDLSPKHSPAAAPAVVEPPSGASGGGPAPDADEFPFCDLEIPSSPSQSKDSHWDDP